MLNKNFSLLTITAALMAIAAAHAADAKPVTPAPAAQTTASRQASAKEKDDIMLRDQIDTTDIFGIQLDESEIEQEQEVDWDENNDTFPLPHSK